MTGLNDKVKGPEPVNVLPPVMPKMKTDDRSMSDVIEISTHLIDNEDSEDGSPDQSNDLMKQIDTFEERKDSN